VGELHDRRTLSWGNYVIADIAVSDIDWERGVLLVRESEFGKSRNVPVTTSTLEALNRYAQLRPRFRPAPGNPSFFVSLTGRRLIYVSVHDVFARLRTDAGIGAASTTPARIHDLRHSLPSRHCWTGIATVTTSPRAFPGCRPTSAIANHALPTGTYRPRPNCALQRRNGSSRS